MNAPTPQSTPLEVAIAAYKTALNSLEIPNILLNKERVLEILAARDALQKQLENDLEIAIEMRSKLVEQDNRLKQNVSVEAKENWRKCFELSQGKERLIEEEQWLYEAQKQLNLK
jgi:lipid A disaccharide synthetase